MSPSVKAIKDAKEQAERDVRFNELVEKVNAVLAQFNALNEKIDLLISENGAEKKRKG